MSQEEPSSGQGVVTPARPPEATQCLGTNCWQAVPAQLQCYLQLLISCRTACRDAHHMAQCIPACRPLLLVLVLHAKDRHTWFQSCPEGLLQVQERAMHLDAGCSVAPHSESCQMLHPTGPTLPAGLCSPWKKAECRGPAGGCMQRRPADAAACTSAQRACSPSAAQL